VQLKYKHLGPGLLESVYEKCFLRELSLRGIAYKNQLWVPVQYKSLEIDTELRLEVLVEEILCLELKAQEGLLPILDAILLSYMQIQLRLSRQFWGKGASEAVRAKKK